MQPQPVLTVWAVPSENRSHIRKWIHEVVAPDASAWLSAIETQTETWRDSEHSRAWRWSRPVNDAGVNRSMIIIPAISLASELRRYGEDAHWPRALTLSASEMVDIGQRAGELLGTKSTALWADGPRGSRPVLLAGIEYLEGDVRPATRNRSRPIREMPDELRSTETERMAAANEVAQEYDRRMK